MINQPLIVNNPLRVAFFARFDSLFLFSYLNEAKKLKIFKKQISPSTYRLFKIYNFGTSEVDFLYQQSWQLRRSPYFFHTNCGKKVGHWRTATVDKAISMKFAERKTFEKSTPDFSKVVAPTPPAYLVICEFFPKQSKKPLLLGSTLF